MPINFPSSPTLNQTYTFGGKTWVYNGTGWALTASGDISPGQVDAFLTLLGATAIGKALFAAATGNAARDAIALTAQAPSFSATKSAAQTFSSGAYTKITFPNEDYDHDACYDTGNSRFTPNVEGVYSIKASIGLGTTGALSRAIIAIYKNGASHKNLLDISTLMYTCSGSVDVYMNGSTDYVEVFVYLAATTPSVDGNAALSYFQAHLARRVVPSGGF